MGDFGLSEAGSDSSTAYASSSRALSRLVNTAVRGVGSACARSASSGSGRVSKSQLFQRRKRPIYTPTLLNTSAAVANAQPARAPTRRATAACSRASEVSPSSRPVKAAVNSSSASYHSGAAAVGRR